MRAAEPAVECPPARLAQHDTGDDAPPGRRKPVRAACGAPRCVPQLLLLSVVVPQLLLPLPGRFGNSVIPTSWTSWTSRTSRVTWIGILSLDRRLLSRLYRLPHTRIRLIAIAVGGLRLTGLLRGRDGLRGGRGRSGRLLGLGSVVVIIHGHRRPVEGAPLIGAGGAVGEVLHRQILQGGGHVLGEDIGRIR